jgi:hypothetical protein
MVDSVTIHLRQQIAVVRMAAGGAGGIVIFYFYIYLANQ